MNRRNALKGLGLSLGYVVTTPTVLALLQSCKNDAKNLNIWAPKFFSESEGIVMKIITDLILPKTNNLPGALDLGIPEFLDLYIDNVYTEKEKQETKEGLKTLITELNFTINNPASNLSTEAFNTFLTKYLKITKEEEKVLRENKNNNVILNTLHEIRYLTIWAYKTTEEIGEKVLAYDPIPGEQKGCISLKEATGGKAWSL